MAYLETGFTNAAGAHELVICDDLSATVDNVAICRAQSINAVVAFTLASCPDLLINYDDVRRFSLVKFAGTAGESVATADGNYGIVRAMNQIGRSSNSALGKNIIRVGLNPGCFALCSDTADTESLEEQIRSLQMLESHKKDGLHRLSRLHSRSV